MMGPLYRMGLAAAAVAYTSAQPILTEEEVRAFGEERERARINAAVARAENERKAAERKAEAQAKRDRKAAARRIRA